MGVGEGVVGETNIMGRTSGWENRGDIIEKLVINVFIFYVFIIKHCIVDKYGDPCIKLFCCEENTD